MNSKTLQEDPEKRPTAQEALQHHWVAVRFISMQNCCKHAANAVAR